MSDNAQFWKDLLGDDYKELLDSVKSDNKQDRPVIKPTNGPDLRPSISKSISPADTPANRPPARQNIPADNKQAQRPVEGRPAQKMPSPNTKPEPLTSQDEDDGVRFYQFNPVQGGERTNERPTGAQPLQQSSSDMNNNDKDDDFEMEFDFDGEYSDIPDKNRSSKRGGKRMGCFGGVLFAVLTIAFCLLLASVLWLAATDVLGLGKADERVQVTVPEDYTLSSIADTLHEKGLVKYKFLFKLYEDFSNAKEKITPGTFELNKNYDYRALVNGMNIHGGKRVEVDITIPEGFTLKQIIELFVANNICTEKELWDAAANYDFDYDFLDKSTLGNKYRLEGFLFPDTYSFYVGDSPNRAFSKMLSNFQTKFKADYVTRAKTLGYSQRDIIIIASMIEKEAGSDDERDKIASVIYNRLKSSNFPYLQIDATIYYAIAETGQAFSTDVDSPYNTYKQKGLPAGPIANPGIASIKAALYPKTTNYYYYALNKSKTHNFFSDSASFKAFVKSDKYGG